MSGELTNSPGAVVAGRAAGAGPSPYARRRRSADRARRRRIYRRRRLSLLGVLCLVGFGSWSLAGSGSPALSASRDPGHAHLAADPKPLLDPVLPQLSVLPGAAPVLPFPGTGESAVFVKGVGVMGATRDEASVPIASVTKVMTAIIILRDHPLGSGSGPVFTMTAADHAAWEQAVANGDSSVEVVAGERLTERQLLEALMIPSACNIADYLARWDAGSIAAFVRKMNLMAAWLGLTETHYADASGVDPGSRSSAIDQAVLGAYAVTVPGMVSIEDHPEMWFPVEGMAPNYNPALGQEGVIGLKSGFTDAAQACLVAAAWREVGGRSVLVVTATLGQPTGLDGAAQVDLQLLSAATDELGQHSVLTAGDVVAHASGAWTSLHPAVIVTAPVSVVGWGGLSLRTQLTGVFPFRSDGGRGWRPGTRVGYLTVSAPAGLLGDGYLWLRGAMPAAPVGWSPASASARKH